MDLVFCVQDGKEYVKASNMIAVSEKNIDVLPTEGDATCTISPDGYAVWYHIAPTDAGKTIHVKTPEHGSFAVYENGKCTEFSWSSGHDTATLPAGGMIVFAGDPGVTFEMSFSPAR
ncbi:MAG: hypothetical protein VB144_12165 [Clostridia bacterium]|nr:hypothetical protein [Clostridia bacterium]